MQVLIDLIVGFIALLVVSALTQFGVDMTASRQNIREVHRVSDCDEPHRPQAFAMHDAKDC